MSYSETSSPGREGFDAKRTLSAIISLRADWIDDPRPSVATVRYFMFGSRSSLFVTILMLRAIATSNNRNWEIREAARNVVAVTRHDEVHIRANWLL